MHTDLKIIEDNGVIFRINNSVPWTLISLLVKFYLTSYISAVSKTKIESIV